MAGTSKGPVFSVPPVLTPGSTCRSKQCQLYSFQYVLPGVRTGSSETPGPVLLLAIVLNRHIFLYSACFKWSVH